MPNRIAELKYLIEMPYPQIEFVLPNQIAESNCRIFKLNSFCQIELPDRQIEFVLPNQNAKSIWQTI
jgi:hypothetical protein